MKQPGRRVFWMEPAFTPPEKPVANAAGAKRTDVAYTTAAQDEMRLLRREIQQAKDEMTMKVSELSASIDKLIELATALKNAPPVVAPVVDDPAVEALHTKIADALEVLSPPAPITPPPVSPIDPNQPIDPNAPILP